ncbi:MAG: hypothetical protein O9350_01820 [Microcystis sp. LE19-388.1G]|nr:hypothetical protein [Microcystis sp. LE19-388.1G]
MGKWGSEGVGCGVWGSGVWGVGCGVWGVGRINRNNLLSPVSCLLSPVSYLLSPISYLLSPRT